MSLLLYSVGQSSHRVHQDLGKEHIDPTDGRTVKAFASQLRWIPILSVLKELSQKQEGRILGSLKYAFIFWAAVIK